MSNTVPYCEVSDLLVGDVPLPADMRPQKYVDDGADEIDSAIGFVYQTPVDIHSDDTPVVRPVRLLLKRLNVQLSSGRLIMAMSMGSQRQELHAYGWSLVQGALKVLEQIAAGDIILIGAPVIPPSDETQEQFTGPQIYNVDGESNVESFYDRIANPNYCYGPGPVGYNSKGLVA